jgi:Protein of unknown function (DUF3168)
MTGAVEAVHAALIDALAGVAPLYGAGPPRAEFPYIMISDSPVTDWSTKTQAGREIRLALNIWDDGEDPARMAGLVSAVEAALAAFPRDLPGWRLASLVFLRSLVSRDAAGPWVALVEHRIRVLTM